jgi:hypothetical protein
MAVPLAAVPTNMPKICFSIVYPRWRLNTESLWIDIVLDDSIDVGIPLGPSVIVDDVSEWLADLVTLFITIVRGGRS